MYYVYRRNKLVGRIHNLEEAKLLARKVKGLIMRDNQIWFDYR